MIIIEPHYLGCLEYFALLAQHKKIFLEVNDSFQKQTYRNRAYFLISNKTQPLSIPVNYSNGMHTKDVRVDYSQRWVKDHWGAFYSGYGKAPFFEYFSEQFRSIWEMNHTFLVDLNIAFMESAAKALQIELDVNLTESYMQDQESDYRNVINPKKPFSDRKIYRSYPYTQLFGDTFVPNLSIVDLIMCEGPNSAQILTHSYLKKN